MRRVQFRCTTQWRFWYLLFIFLTPCLPFGPGAVFAGTTYMLAEFWIWHIFPEALGFSFFPNWISGALIGAVLTILIMWAQKRAEIEIWAQVYASISDLEDKNEKIQALEQEKKEMEAKNAQIQNRLAQIKLTSNQTSLIELSKEKFLEKFDGLHVDAFRDITFLDRLGEGSFGQCFSGM